MKPKEMWRQRKEKKMEMWWLRKEKKRGGGRVGRDGSRIEERRIPNLSPKGEIMEEREEREEK